MDPGLRSPLVDFFRRGEVAHDVRLFAAQGAFAPRAHEQLAILLVLVDDAHPDVARTAAATIDRLPEGSLARFLGRSDVPGPMREFFVARGIIPEGTSTEATDLPLIDAAADDAEVPDTEDPKALAMMPVIQRMKLAMRGTREQRGQLIRDSNRLVASAVLSSPKLTDAEIESFARMANLSEDILRTIGMNRSWTKSYNVIAALARNPKTPPAMSMGFLQRLNDRDLKMISIDRNVSEPVRLAAKKFVVKNLK